MAGILPIIQIVIAILLIIAILLQQRGSGLSSVFGGEGEAYHTRRGLEKKIFIGTVALAGLFFAISFINLFW
ncbi:MAG: preprotein translocase subunit SecG [Patescibacteria group bacterium]